MADDRNNQVVGYPTREIRVTGERCASMVHTTVAVSRFEIQLVNMSMAGASNMRDAVRKSSDRFKRALEAFEAELRECQRELDLASKRKRPANRKPSGKPVQRTAQDQANNPAIKQPSSASTGKTAANSSSKPNKAEQNQQAKAPAPQGQAQKPSDSQKGAGGKQKQKPVKQRPAATEEASAAQRPATPSTPETEQQPAVVPDKGAEQQPKASTSEPAPKADPAIPVLV
ncbi:MAG: hypothetical protein CMK74_03650 [Pseudomonadales bacterium]|nr:hypothetical protein [Pseudomonadales bacterium]|tara:strand:+ start:11990 stop:12676 length:687 start_codon:yes stop_codon:yes gene_type:complete